MVKSKLKGQGHIAFATLLTDDAYFPAVCVLHKSLKPMKLPLVIMVTKAVNDEIANELEAL
jgi:hypothetical protein